VHAAVRLKKKADPLNRFRTAGPDLPGFARESVLAAAHAPSHWSPCRLTAFGCDAYAVFWIDTVPEIAGAHRSQFGAEREDNHDVAWIHAKAPARKAAEARKRNSGKPPTSGKVGHVLNSLHGVDLESSRWADLAIVVQRAQMGDREAFGELVEQFQPTVYAIALRRLGNPTDALELTQEVFLHVLQRIGQLREPERFAGWLRQVAVRMAINRATRRVAPASVDTVVLEGACEGGDEPLEQLISRERAERLWEALGELKSLDREALDAFYIRGLTLIEIAQTFEVPLGTVKRRLHTARKRLKRALEASVIDVDEWSDSQNPRYQDDIEKMEMAGAGACDTASWS
jgi:RNA polymerase sigma-70 factor (ECF subfamily)